MTTFIENVQASTAQTAPAKTRDKTDRPLKPQKLDVYYDNLYLEYYYFCQ